MDSDAKQSARCLNDIIATPCDLTNGPMQPVNYTMAPATKLLNSPVIIIGMHRSGTSLLSRILAAAGVFQGAGLDRFNESVFFQLLNEQLLRLADTTWDFPEKAGDLSIASPIKTVLTEYAASVMDEQLLQGYWGGSYYDSLKHNVMPPVTGWGWKDPRSTLLLPVWLDLFEESKIIHVIRHGIDSSVSLWRRENYDQSSPRCTNLKECFKIWEAYVEKGREYGKAAKQYKEIHYEELIAHPVEVMDSLSSFLQIEICAETVLQNVEINDNRRFAYQKDDPSKDFYSWARRNALLQTLYPNC